MKIAVIGGGAAGSFAAIAAAQEGASVTIFERNEKIGKKLYLTGKGRCNLTNEADVATILSNIVTNPKFMTSALYQFPPEAVIRFFEERGMPTKTERGRRVFPESDKSSDVIKVLKTELERWNVRVFYRAYVSEILCVNDQFIVKTNDLCESFDKVILATGGLSYPVTGSTGDGYRFAKAFGHSIVPPVAALNALLADNEFICKNAGLTLKNVELTVKDGRFCASEFGELLLTHNGLSGPVALRLSSRINRRDVSSLTAYIDFKPALTSEQLDKRLLHDFQTYQNKDLKNALNDLLPKALIDYVIEKAGLKVWQKVNTITKEQRLALGHCLKHMAVQLKGLEKIEQAVITSGGVCVKEVDSKTMQSKLVKGLYFAGEILDVDAYTGGYNLQIAFASGYAAGKYSVLDS